MLYPAPAVNQPPTVDAGPDKTITLPAGVTLTGIARDDGLPSPGLTTTWSKISGREDSAGGTVMFANPNAPATTATFGADGIYVLRLTVSDGAVTVSDDVTITVNPAPPNTAPKVNAGADADDHAAVVDVTHGDGNRRRTARLRRRSSRRAWTKISGPGTVTFSSSDGADHLGDVLNRRNLRAPVHRLRQRARGV